MTFMGDILLSDELQLSEVHLKAITKVPALKHQFEGRRFLCSVQFCATFIPQLALISALSGICPPKMPDGNSAPKNSSILPNQTFVDLYTSHGVPKVSFIQKNLGYSQFEREILAVKWKCKKFFLFL